MTIRKLTIREDEHGLFIRYKDWNDHLILRIGTITEASKRGFYSKGDKVKVRHWNKPMGYFLVEQPGGHGATCMWQGPRYDNQIHKWVYDK
jgi:hypothetical protein